MSDFIRGKLNEAGHALSEAAHQAAGRVTEKAGELKEWAAEKLDQMAHGPAPRTPDDEAAGATPAN